MPRTKQTTKTTQRRKQSARTQPSISNTDQARQRTKRKRTRRSSINHHQTNPIATTQPHPESAEHPKSPEIGHFSPTITLSSQSLQSNPSDQELHQSDSDSNDNKQLNRNQSTHSLINQTSTYQTSNTTRQNLTTNEPLHNQERNNESSSITTNTLTAINNEPSTSNIQTSITTYFLPAEPQFQRIADLNEHSTNFEIRSKIIFLNNVRHFDSNKVIDGILSDASGEIKFVAFNAEAERVIANLKINQKIILENGEIVIANTRYRSPFSRYEIRICPSTVFRTFQSNSFNPLIQLNKKPLRDVSQMPHGSLVDVEGMVILDRGLIISNRHDDTDRLIRRTFKIADDTSTINVTVWNDKTDEIPENITNKTIRLRNAKTNHYNDYVSINVSSQTIIQFHQ